MWLGVSNRAQIEGSKARKGYVLPYLGIVAEQVSMGRRMRGSVGK